MKLPTPARSSITPCAFHLQQATVHNHTGMLLLCDFWEGKEPEKRGLLEYHAAGAYRAVLPASLPASPEKPSTGKILLHLTLDSSAAGEGLKRHQLVSILVLSATDSLPQRKIP